MGCNKQLRSRITRKLVRPLTFHGERFQWISLIALSFGKLDPRKKFHFFFWFVKIIPCKKNFTDLWSPVMLWHKPHVFFYFDFSYINIGWKTRFHSFINLPWFLFQRVNPILFEILWIWPVTSPETKRS